MAQPKLRGWTRGSHGGTAKEHTINLSSLSGTPGGEAKAGDKVILVVVASKNPPGTIETPAGWTREADSALLSEGTGVARRAAVFTKQLTASETFNVKVSENMAAWSLVYVVEAGTWSKLVVNSEWKSETSATIKWASATTLNDEAMVALFGTFTSLVESGIPSTGWTNEGSGGGVTREPVGQEKIITPAGASSASDSKVKTSGQQATLAVRIEPALVFKDSGSGTTVSSGSGVEAWGTVYKDTGSGTSTSSGSGTDSCAAKDAGSGSTASQGSASEQLRFTDTGSGTTVSTGSGVGAEVDAGQGSGTTVSSGSGVESHVAVDVGPGSTTSAGSGLERCTFTDSGAGVGVSSGSGIDSWERTGQFSDTGQGTSVSTGSGIEAWAAADATAGSTISTGGGAEHLVFHDGAAGNSTSSGAALEAHVAHDFGVGRSTSSGSASYVDLHTDSGSGQSLSTGSGSERVVFVDHGSGATTSTGTGHDHWRPQGGLPIRITLTSQKSVGVRVTSHKAAGIKLTSEV